jgi:hypothetical protein
MRSRPIAGLCLLLVACGPSGPKSEAEAKAAVEARLAERYGDAFTVAKVRQVARGLDGFGADRHAFEAYPDADPAKSFDGLVDFDEEHATWSDDWPCIRDQDALQAALDAVLDGKHSGRAESVCSEALLGTADVTVPGATFVWTAQVSVFGGIGDGVAGPDALLAANEPVHAELVEAATAAGVQHYAWQVDRYERGEAIVMPNGDHPLSPAMQMWLLGSTVSREDLPVQVSKFFYRATGVEAELQAIAETKLPPTGEVWVRVRSNARSENLVKQASDAALADIPRDYQSDLVGIVTATVVGTPEEQGPAVRDWLTHLHQSLSEGRFSPTTYVAFYDPDTDPDVPRHQQADKQGTIWMINSGVGLRVRRQTMEGIQPITVIRYVVPGDSP